MLKSFEAILASDASLSVQDVQNFRQIGPLLRALVASRTQGLVLELHTQSGLGTAWMQDGLHADIPLVVIGPNAPTLQAIEETLPADLRLAFHAADASTFLSDMSDKRFDLILDHRQHSDASSLKQVEDALSPGGMIITRVSPDLSLPATLKTAAIENSPWSLLSLGPRPKTRRGGRQGHRSRQAESRQAENRAKQTAPTSVETSAPATAITGG